MNKVGADLTSWAFLIQAHEDPHHLKELVESLSSEQSSFFIHIDAKANLRDFKFLLSGLEVYFIEERVNVRWGGWSQVQATLNLIAAARASGRSFRYFTLLSGTHYPTRWVGSILDWMTQDGREYINLVAVPNVAMNKTMVRFTRYYIEGAHRASGIFGISKSILFRLINKIPLRNPDRVLKGRKLFAGSNWWTLSDEAIALVEQTVENDPELVDYFRHVKCSDESFFQTIIGNSVLLARCFRADVYTDWSNPADAPCFLTMQHVPMLLSSEAKLSDEYGTGPINFARKCGTRNRTVVQALKAGSARDAPLA